jgi:hypothetical protein
MDRNAFQLRLLVVFFILALFVSPAPARTIDVGDSVCELVEADWIEQDQDQAENADFSLEYTNQLISRGYMLAKRLRALSASESRLEPLVTELRRLEARLADAASTAEERRGMYLDVRRTIRNIAFCNPLLDFDKILFIKRHDSVGVFHMCDQYYGCNAKPGGGLFVLSDPFGENPKLTNVLENSVVERGRLRGDSLSTGAFLSPELSYDGKTILFAYTQAKAYEKYRGKEAYEWGPEISYHIFKVNADGTGLVQLTDGDSDDFDPCYLPNGRIVFITERRGGYLRCGRHCPVYTMYSMEPDGSDIICVSFHETHEWHPSVDNDGMLVYTRWDYVDRDTNIGDEHPRDSRVASLRCLHRLAPRQCFRLADHDRPPRRRRPGDVAAYPPYARYALPRSRGQADSGLYEVWHALAAQRGRLPLCLRCGCEEPRHLLDRPFRQPRTALSRPGHLVPEPDSAAPATQAAGDSQRDRADGTGHCQSRRQRPAGNDHDS